MQRTRSSWISTIFRGKEFEDIKILCRFKQHDIKRLYKSEQRDFSQTYIFVKSKIISCVYRIKTILQDNMLVCLNQKPPKYPLKSRKVKLSIQFLKMNVTFHKELFTNTILDSNTFKILHGISSIFVIAIAFISYLGFIHYEYYGEDPMRAVHKWHHPFFEIFDPSLPLVTHFTK